MNVGQSQRIRERNGDIPIGGIHLPDQKPQPLKRREESVQIITLQKTTIGYWTLRPQQPGACKRYTGVFFLQTLFNGDHVRLSRCYFANS